MNCSLFNSAVSAVEVMWRGMKERIEMFGELEIVGETGVVANFRTHGVK